MFVGLACAFACAWLPPMSLWWLISVSSHISCLDQLGNLQNQTWDTLSYLGKRIFFNLFRAETLCNQDATVRHRLLGRSGPQFRQGTSINQKLKADCPKSQLALLIVFSSDIEFWNNILHCDDFGCVYAISYANLLSYLQTDWDNHKVTIKSITSNKNRQNLSAEREWFAHGPQNPSCRFSIPVDLFISTSLTLLYRCYTGSYPQTNGEFCRVYRAPEPPGRDDNLDPPPKSWPETLRLWVAAVQQQEVPT